MAISSSSSSSCCSRSCVVVVSLFVLLGWLTVTAAAAGTTRNLRDIMIGRCHSYQNLINPLAFKTGPKDCAKLYDLFHKGFAYKDPCNVTVSDFESFSQAASHGIREDSTIFWEGVYPFVNELSYFGKRYTAIADTLSGYMVDMLTFCGKKGAPGINYTKCPDKTTCPSNIRSTFTSFWRSTSKYFAQAAKGTVHVMMNGTSGRAYSNDSTFGAVEIKNWKMESIKEIRVYVVHALGQIKRERCGTGSIRQLQQELNQSNFKVSCIDDPDQIRHLMCTDNPGSKACAFLNNSNTAKQIEQHSLLMIMAAIFAIFCCAT